jgi:hypothetical protein
MATLFAPPGLFSAFSYAVQGDDPDLVKGTHLRVFAGLGASFPLTPFAVFKIVSRRSEPHGLHVTDRDGKQAGGLYLSQLGVADVTPMLGDSDTAHTVRVELRPDVDGGIKGAQLFDQSGRVVAERNRAPFLFSAPRLHRFRLWGPAQYVNVMTSVVDSADIANRGRPLVAERILGLPVAGLHPWYCGVQTRQDGLNRVAAGAPRRLNPMDRPDGPFDPVTADDELARVEALLGAAELGGGLEKLLANLVDDQSAPPWLQIEKQRMPTGGARSDQVAEVPRLGNLQVAAIDPGLARFLGFADHIDDLPDLVGGGWNALAVAGLFAIDLKRFDPGGLLGLQDPEPNEGALALSIVQALVARGGDRVRGEIDELVTLMRTRGLLVRAMVAVTAPTPPWLAPSLPTPLLGEHRWQTAGNDAASMRYRASFAFHDAPLASMASMAAEVDGSWQSRHDSVDVGNLSPPRRATPRIFGREQSAWASARAHKLAKAAAHHAGLLADLDIPAEPGVIRYRCRASDLFGRFGDAAEFDVGPPPRPAPPPPVIRFHIDPAAVDPSLPDALSPGVVRLTFAVAQPPPAPRFAAADEDRLASAMVVPTIGDLAAGSQPISQASVSLGADTQVIDLTVVGMIDVAFLLPPLLPQATTVLTLSARFIDSAGVASAVASLPVKVTDRRPPKVYPSGIGLFWTSAPGPSPDVELQLAWPAAAGAQFRVYATDQQGLGLTAAELVEPVPSATPSRGRVAQVGGNKVLGGAPVSRTNFRLLTDKPVVAGPDARAVLKSGLARSLETVQFLRVVPLSAEGAEAPFDSCGIVPVAVPDSRRPAPPRLDGSVDPATGIASLTVIADGFDGIGLRRDEPGLFDAGAPAAVPPDFRIRRAVGAVADPIYGRPVAAGTLARDAAAAPAVVLLGAASDDNSGRGLEPFVRYVYWADVRLPPERRLPAGVAPIDAPGGVTVLDPGNAASHVRPMSLPSAPRVLLRVPADPPAALAEAAITATRAAPDGAGAVEVTIEVANPPIAHPKAIGPYRLAVWTQWPDQSILPVAIVNGAALDGNWPDFTDGAISLTVAPPALPVVPASAITLRVALVDPVGRMGGVTAIALP